MKHPGALKDGEKEFLKLFNELTYYRNGWQVWEDLMTVMACAISNSVDRTEQHFEKRERQYEAAIRELGGVDIPAQIFGIVTMELERDPDQDFLGKLYMSLNLGSHWHGQFFTPYSVSRMMAEIGVGGVRQKIEEQGYVSFHDPCIGAGAMMIAAANHLRRANINYQNHALFTGQDVDRVVAMMAYIQLSLLGCPGYIYIGNSLLHPPTGHVLFPHESEGLEVWITPFFQSKVWQMRRAILQMERFCGTETTLKTVEKEHFYMFFNFKEQEELQYE